MLEPLLLRLHEMPAIVLIRTAIIVAAIYNG
jgi:hypothetical protein